VPGKPHLVVCLPGRLRGVVVELHAASVGAGPRPDLDPAED
jgi:hypothetical protein